MIHPSLRRYIPILENPDAFFACLVRPLSTTVWVNELKIQTTKLEQAFTTIGWEWFRVPWYSGGYRLNGIKPGRSLPFSCGWYNVQEEITWSVVKALDPQPGDRVLDLCAAPGGKTAQLSLAVGPTGSVMANERSLPRLSSLVNTITRLGLTNVVTSQGDGRLFQARPHSFDRVVVDVPCSGEGTLRKKVGRRSLDQENWNKRHSRRLASIQKQLLDRALDLVKPGGWVVYSTCTFAPEENEAVIDEVVGDRGIIEPCVIQGLQADPGICQWQGQTFRPDSQYAQRYWPHLNNTGGFFVARIRRTETGMLNSRGLDNAPSADATSAPPNVRQANDGTALEWLCDRFGIPSETFQAYTLWLTGQEKMWIADQSCTALATSVSAPLETIGLPLVRRTPHSFKPTTVGLQRFGPYIQDQSIILDKHQCNHFMGGHHQTLDSVSIEPQQAENTSVSGDPQKGFIHVRYGPYELGCGRVKNGVLYSEIPKALRFDASTHQD